MEDEIAAWLRRQAEADLAAASAATDGPWEIRDMQVWGATRAHAGGRPGEVLVVKHTWPQEAGHITRHDPRTETARAESVLAVLGEYEAAVTVMESQRVRPEGVGPGVFACVRTLHRTVRLLAWGYRSREEYKETWKP